MEKIGQDRAGTWPAWKYWVGVGNLLLNSGHGRKSCPDVWTGYGCRKKVGEISCQHLRIMIPQGIKGVHLQIYHNRNDRSYQELWRVCDFYCLQTSKLACHSFMGVGRRHEIPGQRQRTLLWHSKQHDFRFALVPLFPESREGNAERRKFSFWWHIWYINLKMLGLISLGIFLLCEIKKKSYCVSLLNWVSFKLKPRFTRHDQLD